jgi:hypothetical protein
MDSDEQNMIAAMIILLALYFWHYRLPRDTFLLNAIACKERVGSIDIDESVSFCFNQVTL